MPMIRLYIKIQHSTKPRLGEAFGWISVSLWILCCVHNGTPVVENKLDSKRVLLGAFSESVLYFHRSPINSCHRIMSCLWCACCSRVMSTVCVCCPRVINQSINISFIQKGTLQRTSKYSHRYTWSWLICYLAITISSGEAAIIPF